MGRPDWHATLVGVTSTEYADWHRFYRAYYFQDTQLDMHFSGLAYAVLSLFFCGPDIHPSDFGPPASWYEEEQVERPDEDEMLMQRAAGFVGGVRLDGDGGRGILSSADVADVMVDDTTLMVVSVGIPGGVRHVPAGW